MPILQTLCDAFGRAIDAYEAEVAPNVPINRQTEIATLRRRLIDCQTQPPINALVFRQEMVDYVRNLPAGFFAFIPKFDSRLRKKLQVVLAQPCFSEIQLMMGECADMQTNHQAQITALTERVNQLLEQINQECAKDNVQRVNALTKELAVERGNIAHLTERNTVLSASLQSTGEELDALRKKYDQLLVEHEALKKNQASSLNGSLLSEETRQNQPTFFV